MTCNTRNQSSGVGRRTAVPAAAKLPPVPRPAGTAWTRRLNGFTLVELLVVVVIISMLVGLLLPAVMGARANARKTECANNQRQLGVAIIGYETAKKRLPGYANQVRGTTVSWVPVLFPFLGRMDLWEGATGWRMGFSGAPSNFPPTPYIGLLVCPNDVKSTGTPQLTYIVNCGLYDNPADAYPDDVADMSVPGVFRHYGGGSSIAISLSDVKSPSQTIMLSEKLAPPKLWSTPAPTYVINIPLDGSCVGFLWPDTSLTGQPIEFTLIGLGPPATLPPPLPAIHPGVVIVTFCDGHVAEIVEDTPCKLYIGAP